MAKHTTFRSLQDLLIEHGSLEGLLKVAAEQVVRVKIKEGEYRIVVPMPDKSED